MLFVNQNILKIFFNTFIIICVTNIQITTVNIKYLVGDYSYSTFNSTSLPVHSLRTSKSQIVKYKYYMFIVVGIWTRAHGRLFLSNNMRSSDKPNDGFYYLFENVTVTKIITCLSSE